MTTVANIKGYINGEEWGVYTPAPALKTWEEIQTYTDASALLTELNTYPTEYYNMINEEGYMLRDPCAGVSDDYYIMGNTQGTTWKRIANKIRYYDSYNLTWKNLNSAPCPS